jgi:hypothetical protein
MYYNTHRFDPSITTSGDKKGKNEIFREVYVGLVA